MSEKGFIMFALARDEYDAVTANFEAVKMMNGTENAEIIIRLDTKKISLLTTSDPVINLCLPIRTLMEFTR